MGRMLELTEVRKAFGGVRALDALDLHVLEGEILSVIGPNGAGKTTLFNVVTGMIPLDGGEIRFRGRSIAGLRPSRIVERGIARTFQAGRLFPQMTVRENVMVARYSRTRSGVLATILRTPGFRREEKMVSRVAEETLALFGNRFLGYRFDQPAMALSQADRRRLDIARALGTDPKLLLLDEPTAGMNPNETEEMTRLIGRLRDERALTIVVIEHDIRVVRGVSDRVVALDHGRKIAEGTYQEVARDPRVIEAHLGTRSTA